MASMDISDLTVLAEASRILGELALKPIVDTVTARELTRVHLELERVRASVLATIEDPRAGSTATSSRTRTRKEP